MDRLDRIDDLRWQAGIDPDYDSVAEALGTAIIETKAVLPPRSRVIVLARWPLDGNVKPLEDLADTFGLTPERIRQIEFAAVDGLLMYLIGRRG